MVLNTELNTATIPLTVAQGGTGISSATAYALICGGTTSTGVLQPLSSVGTSGFCLSSGGAGALPSFSAMTTAIAGTNTNNDASAGNLGEVISSVILVASGITLSTGSTANITSIALTAGDWDVYGTVYYTPSSSTSTTIRQGAISTTSVTIPLFSDNTQAAYSWVNPSESLGTTVGAFPLAPCRQSLSGTTTVYLVANSTFSTGGETAYGYIYGRRVR